MRPTAKTTHIDLLSDFSLEATLPKQWEIDHVRDHVSSGTLIYLSAPPKLSLGQLADLACKVRSAGFEPVPHIVARTYPSHRSLDDLLSRISGEAGVTKALVLAGDRTEAAGPFPDALSIIESDLLQSRGIVEIGISSYPDGHSKMSNDVLATAFADKARGCAAA